MGAHALRAREETQGGAGRLTGALLDDPAGDRALRPAGCAVRPRAGRSVAPARGRPPCLRAAGHVRHPPWVSSQALRRTAAALLVLAAAACKSGPPPLYSWGSYQDVLYESSVRAGDTTDAQHLRTLEDEVAEMRQAGKRPGPGIQAHIGWLHLRSGDTGGAASWFALEKQDFPESAQYLDALLGGGAKP